jgi:histidinol-phosphate/aromatic aminotransferase/cobyric acid decarboxylase-like protein
MNAMPTFAVYTNNRNFLGYVSGVSHKQASVRAERKFGYGLDVELCVNVKPLAKDVLNANVAYEAKTARRYPTTGFEARRAALIAAHKAG